MFTFLLFKNGFHELWRYCFIFMVFALVVFVPNWLAFLCDLLAGVLAAAIVFVLTTADWPPVEQFDPVLWGLVVIYTAGAGYLFSSSNLQGQLARKRNETITATAASMAHELRNPLAQVRQSLELIELELAGFDARLPPSHQDRARQLAHLAHRAGMASLRGQQVVEMILREVRGGSVLPQRMSVQQASDLTAKAVSEYAYDAPTERARVHLDTGGDFFVRADETLYVFVIFNLLKNALYFVANRPDGRIDIRLEKGARENRVVFRDNGPGIGPEDMSRLFDGFFSRRPGSGIGLGLAYCRRTMRAFGGEILCESRLGEYTVFTLIFPRLSQAEIDSSLTARRAGEAARLAGRRLLAVDDDPTVCALLRDMLEPLGCEVDEAHGCEPAAALLRTRFYDLAMVDLNMPGENGDALALAATQGWLGPAPKRTPLVAYSSEPPESALRRAHRSGMREAIAKTTPEDELIERLAALLAEPTARDEASWRGRRVLVVDDASLGRELLCEALKTWGLEVAEAADGRSALARIGEGSFDLLLTDLRMPGMDGMALCRAVRTHPLERLRGLPIVTVSALVDPEIRQRAMDAGATEVHAKPLERAALRTLLLRLWGGVQPAPLAWQPPPETQAVRAPEATRSADAQRAKQRATFTDSLAASAPILRVQWQSGERLAVAEFAHRIAGTAHILGLRDLSRCAIAVERRLRAAPTPEDAPAVEALIREMEETPGSAAAAGG